METSELLASPDYELLCAGLEAQDSLHCRKRELTIPAVDGIALTATAYQPAHRSPTLSVVINSATGVPRSRDGGRGARMLHWGERDIPGALEWMYRYHPRLPLAAIGHSGGGWLFGLAANNRSVDALLTVGSQIAHWRNWPTLRGRLFMWSAMNLMIPGAAHALGYLPGAVFGGESLPRGVALDWARWSSNPRFVVDDAGAPLREHFNAYRNPVRLLAIEDDDYAPPQAVQALAPLYGLHGANAAVMVVRPRDHGLRRLGHFGFFRKTAPRILWDDALFWLRQQAGG